MTEIESRIAASQARQFQDFLYACSRTEQAFAELKALEAEQAARQHKWDLRFLRRARDIALECSKDPSTKTGAVIVDTEGAEVSTGYNGFPRRVKDLPERYACRQVKYRMVVHCECNAIIFGDRARMKGGTLYTWPFQSCAVCAGMVIQAGIMRCVAPPMPPDKVERWKEDMDLAATMFEEAGVQLDIIDLPRQDVEL